MNGLTFAAVAFAAVATLALTAARSGASQVTAHSTTLAAIASVDYRVVVNAREDSSGGAPTADVFELEPLGQEHNDEDYAAWSSSIAFIRPLVSGS